MLTHNVTCLVNSISSPLQLGLYSEDNLIQSYAIEGKTSDVLPQIFEEILKKYTIEQLVYVNGPGSYMAIKVAYVFLKTLSITKQIPFKACSGFDLNGQSPIKALGKKYFIVKDENITVDFCDENRIINDFTLPQQLSVLGLSDDTLPNYQLPVV